MLIESPVSNVSFHQMKTVPYFVNIVKLPSPQPWNRISKMIWIHRTQRPPHHRPDHRVAKVWNGPIIYKQLKSDHDTIINVLSMSLPYREQPKYSWYIAKTMNCPSITTITTTTTNLNNDIEMGNRLEIISPFDSSLAYLHYFNHLSLFKSFMHRFFWESDTLDAYYSLGSFKWSSNKEKIHVEQEKHDR